MNGCSSMCIRKYTGMAYSECNLRKAQMKSLQLSQGIDEGSAALLILLPRRLVAIALRHWLHHTNCE